MTMNELPDLLTAGQYAEYIQLSYRTVKKLLSEGTIKAFKVGREWRIEKEDGKGFDNLREISTMPQLTKHLQTSRTTILRAIKANKLKAMRIGRDLRFKKQDVFEWINEQKGVTIGVEDNMTIRRDHFMTKPRAYTLTFAKVYPMYVQKATKKGKTKGEVDQIIFWLTGYDSDTLGEQINNGTTLESFFDNAPKFNPNASLIKGVICGHRLEEIEDKTIQKIRYLDKLIDELAKGKAMEKILRRSE